MQGYTVQSSNNVLASSAAGTLTTVDAGWYRVAWQMSFTGATNTSYVIQHRTNDVMSGLEMHRTIGTKSSIGNAGALGYLYMPAGVTNSWWAKGDSTRAFLSIYNGSAAINKQSN